MVQMQEAGFIAAVVGTPRPVQGRHCLRAAINKPSDCAIRPGPVGSGSRPKGPRANPPKTTAVDGGFFFSPPPQN